MFFFFGYSWKSFVLTYSFIVLPIDSLLNLISQLNYINVE